MKSTLLAVFGASILSVSALPQVATATGVAPAGHAWVAPGPGDSRSPCPGLNSLANHGFLPHDGRGITVDMFVDACLEGLNVDATFCLPIGILGMMSNCTLATQMDLEQLQHHDVLIEHDGSLSRQDVYFGPDYPVNARSYDMFIAGFDGASETSLKSASATRFGRVNDSIHTNPTVNYGPRELLFSYTETSLYLQTMGRDLLSGVAPVSYIEDFFGNERLPYELGWTKGPVVSLASLGVMDVLLQPLAPSPGDELVYTITAGVLETLLEETGTILTSELDVAQC